MNILEDGHLSALGRQGLFSSFNKTSKTLILSIDELSCYFTATESADQAKESVFLVWLDKEFDVFSFLFGYHCC